MAIIIGDQDTKKQFAIYALPITRTDFKTGERLGVKHFKLQKPFHQLAIEGGDSLGRVVQGAANGSESIIQE